MLSDERIEELRKLVQEEWNLRLSQDEATAFADWLLTLYRALLNE